MPPMTRPIGPLPHFAVCRLRTIWCEACQVHLTRCDCGNVPGAVFGKCPHNEGPDGPPESALSVEGPPPPAPSSRGPLQGDLFAKET